MDESTRNKLGTAQREYFELEARLTKSPHGLDPRAADAWRRALEAMDIVIFRIRHAYVANSPPPADIAKEVLTALETLTHLVQAAGVEGASNLYNVQPPDR